MEDHIRGSKIGEPKICNVRRDGWTHTRRTTFLNHLAATCNVTEACAAAGMSHAGVYAVRRRDPAFAEQWRAALLTGYDTLEAALIRQAMRALHLVEHEELADAPPFDPELAMRLLAQHHARQKDVAPVRRGGARVKRATEAETNAAIMKQLAALDRRLKAKAAREAAAATGRDE